MKHEDALGILGGILRDLNKKSQEECGQDVFIPDLSGDVEEKSNEFDEDHNG